MLQVYKLARLDQPVPLLAAFPFQISEGEPGAGRTSPAMDHVCMSKRDYSTCVEEESATQFLRYKSKNDVKKDD